MRRFILVLALAIAGMSALGGIAEAKRRVVVVPSGSSNSCVERDDEGTCIRRRRDVERERREAETRGESANQYTRSPSSDYSGGGSSYLYWIIAALIMFGGGAFKLLSRGVGVATSAAGSLVRSASANASNPSGDWANKAASRFSSLPEPQPVAAAAVAAPMQSSMVQTPSRSGVISPKPVRSSAGFGRPSAPADTTRPPAPAARETAPPPQPQRAAAVEPQRSAPAFGSPSVRRPRGGIQPRATFGMRR